MEENKNIFGILHFSILMNIKNKIHMQNKNYAFFFKVLWIWKFIKNGIWTFILNISCLTIMLTKWTKQQSIENFENNQHYMKLMKVNTENIQSNWWNHFQ